MTDVETMAEECTVIEIASRLRNGHAVETDEDFRQWVYEYLDNLELGLDHTPIEMFPVLTRFMTEWCDTLAGIGCEQENAQALAAAMGELASCLQRCLAHDGSTRQT